MRIQAIVLSVIFISTPVLAAAPAAVVSGGTSLKASTPSAVPLDAQALHIALSSLLLSATKMAVANVINKTGQAPASNVEAHVGQPDYLTTNEISSITVQPGGVLVVRFTGAVSNNLYTVRLVPKSEQGTVAWQCLSHDITQIQAIESYCRYAPIKGESRANSFPSRSGNPRAY